MDSFCSVCYNRRMKALESGRSLREALPVCKGQLDIQKTMRAAMVTNWLQIFVAAALTLMYLLGYKSGTALFIGILVPVITVGNILFTQRFTQAVVRAEQADSLRTVLENEEMLNRQLRAQRHDFLNHIQVVYSLMQLQEHEEAVTYLKEVYADLKEVGSQLRTSDPAVNALLAAKLLQAQQRALHMEYDIQTRLEHIALESWELCRILGNLLDNAMDAADDVEEGWIKLRLWEDVAGLHFSVANNGAQIPPDLLEKIFAPGFTTKGSRGTGMGLYIIRQILQEAGGKISVDSRDGKTHFVGWIPPSAGLSTQRDS